MPSTNPGCSCVTYRLPGVCHDANQQVQEDDSHHKHVEHHEKGGRLRIAAVIEHGEFKPGHHEAEEGEPAAPDGAELLQAGTSSLPGIIAMVIIGASLVLYILSVLPLLTAWLAMRSFSSRAAGSYAHECAYLCRL